MFFLAAMPFFPLYLTCLPIFLVCGACGVPAFAYIAWRQRYAPLQCLPRFSLLTCKQYRAMDGGLAACRSARRFCNPKKIHGWIFFRQGPSSACRAFICHLAKQFRAMDGGLVACRRARRYFSTSVFLGESSIRQAQGTWFVCYHARPYAPPLSVFGEDAP